MNQQQLITAIAKISVPVSRADFEICEVDWEKSKLTMEEATTELIDRLVAAIETMTTSQNYEDLIITEDVYRYHKGPAPKPSVRLTLEDDLGNQIPVSVSPAAVELKEELEDEITDLIIKTRETLYAELA